MEAPSHSTLDRGSVGGTAQQERGGHWEPICMILPPMSLLPSREPLAGEVPEGALILRKTGNSSF